MPVENSYAEMAAEKCPKQKGLQGNKKKKQHGCGKFYAEMAAKKNATKRATEKNKNMAADKS